MTLNQIFNRKCRVTYTLNGVKKSNVPYLRGIIGIERFVELHKSGSLKIHSIEPLPEFNEQIIRDIKIYCDERNNPIPF